MNILCVGLSLIPIKYSYNKLTEFEKTIIIKNKFQIFSNLENRGSHTYMLSDINNNLYSTKNSLLNLHFYSSELWTSLEEGKQYKVKGYGIRSGLFHIYPNLIEATPQLVSIKSYKSENK